MTIDVASSPQAFPLEGQAVRRLLVVFNPAAGGERRARYAQMLAALQARGCNVTTIETKAPGHAEEIARNLAPDDVDVIVAGGGDGTVNEIVNGLAGKPVALGLMPLGTANVLADELGIPREPAALARVLAEGPLRTIRTGLANGRRFCMMAGTGFDARVVAGVSLPLKKVIGPLAYVVKTAQLVFTDGYAGCDLVIDGTPYRAVSAVVCKGRHYGGPFVAVPAATVHDDLFHVILMHGRGWTSVARYGLALMTGRLGKLSDVQIIAARTVEIAGEAGAPVQADGDIITTLPVRIVIAPESVNMVCPA